MTKNSTVIMDCEFFPCWEWFNAFVNAEDVILEQSEFFRKMSYQNRAYISGPNGIICLSIPLQGGRNQKKILRDIKICNDEKWQTLHWKTLESCYRRSAFYEYFVDALRKYYEKKFTFLLEANLHSLELLLDLFQIKKDYNLSATYHENVEHDLRTKFLPKNRLESNQKEYFQTFGDRNGFEPNLSMLDYLFCCGRWE